MENWIFFHFSIFSFFISDGFVMRFMHLQLILSFQLAQTLVFRAQEHFLTPSELRGRALGSWELIIP